MSGFARFSKKIGSLAGNASKKSGDIVETARLNSEVSRLELDIEDLQFELGRAYYEENKDNPVGPYAEYIAQIRSCEAEIRSCNEKLLAKKGMFYCPQCDAVVDASDEFCSKCGARVPVPAAEQELMQCRNCGASSAVGQTYCSACGFLLK